MYNFVLSLGWNIDVTSQNLCCNTARKFATPLSFYLNFLMPLGTDSTKYQKNEIVVEPHMKIQENYQRAKSTVFSQYPILIICFLFLARNHPYSKLSISNSWLHWKNLFSWVPGKVHSLRFFFIAKLSFCPVTLQM